MIFRRLPCRTCEAAIDAIVSVQPYSYPSNSDPVVIHKTHLRATCPVCRSFIKYVAPEKFNFVEILELQDDGFIAGYRLSPVTSKGESL